MMDTPLFPSTWFSNDFINVYEPSEDTFLLIDAIEQDLQLIVEQKPLIVLEVGSGSGAVITSLAKALGHRCLYFATDLNPEAAATTIKLSTYNKSPPVSTVITNLVGGLEDRLSNVVDVLIFNPPYVPIATDEIPGDGTIASSWAGGTNGMEVTNRFLALVPNLLSPTGNCYLVLLKDNNPEELCLDLHKFGLKSQITLQRRCGSEYLSIVRLSLQTKPN